ncbi:MAG: hypothetical protein ACI8TQ_003990 [Planctomycetota bacterium]|jgi:hypothetical protein
MFALGLQLFVSAGVFLAPSLESRPSDVEAEIARLGDEESEQAVAALTALGKSAVKPLLVVLEEGEIETAWLAARALRDMAKTASSGKSKLIRTLKDEKLEASRRAMACLALEGLGKGANSMSKTLIGNLKDEPSELTILSALTLMSIGESCATELGKAAKGEDLFVAIWSLAVLTVSGEKAKKAGPALRKIYEEQEKTENVNFFALGSLCQRVLDALDHSYEEVRSFNQMSSPDYS